MTVYLDAAVVVPLLLHEQDEDSIVEWLDSTPTLMLSDLAAGEVAAAVHRAVRDGRMPADRLASSLGDFDGWRASDCSPVSHVSQDIRIAADLVRRFELALRMPDAIHLATCSRLGLTLATRDRRILRAALALGIPAVRPGDIAETEMQP